MMANIAVRIRPGTLSAERLPADSGALEADKLANIQSAASMVWLAAEALCDDSHRFLRRRLHHEHAVEDVLQDFYLGVFENAHLLKK